MTTLFILILLIFLIYSLFMRQLNMAIIISLITLLCFLGMSNGLIAAVLLNKLQAPYISQSKPTWANQNVIVLLGAGAVKLPVSNMTLPSIMAYSRINETARLYFDCIRNNRICKVIVSGGDAEKIGISEAVTYQKALLALNINSKDIILEPNSLNTYQNAEFTSAILKKNKFDQIFLVTSGIHLKRAMLYFAHFGIHAKPMPADYLSAQMSLMPRGYNIALSDFAIHEYLGIARLHVYNFFGWNKSVLSPGSL